jgi:WD40 repeat protein
MEFSPDERVLLTLETGRIVRTWDTTRATPLGLDVKSAFDPPLPIFSPDGLRVAIGGTDGRSFTVKVFDVKQGHVVGSLLTIPTLRPTGAAFSNDGRTLVLVSARTTFFFDIETGRALDDLRERSARLKADESGRVLFQPGPGFLPKGRGYLVSGDAVSLLDTVTGMSMGLQLGKQTIGSRTALAPDGTSLLVVDQAGRKVASVAWPPPWTGATDRLRSRIEMMTGLRLTDTNEFQLLSRPQWEARSQALANNEWLN